MVERIEYDEFGLFHENAAEFGLPYDGPPIVRRELRRGRCRPAAERAGVGHRRPELVLLHGGSQNAHTWDTVAMALGRPLVAIDLPGHGHSDGPGERPQGEISPQGNAEDVAVAIRALGPNAQAVVGMSLGGLTTVALTRQAPDLVRKVVLVDVTPGVTRRRPSRSPTSSTARRASPTSTSCWPGPFSTTRPGRNRRCGEASCTTPSSVTTGPGSGAGLAGGRGSVADARRRGGKRGQRGDGPRGRRGDRRRGGTAGSVGPLR